MAAELARVSLVPVSYRNGPVPGRVSYRPLAALQITAMPDAPSLIVVAQSARSLASSAKRAGFAPLAIDVFGDDDTRAISLATLTLDGGLSHGTSRRCAD